MMSGGAQDGQVHKDDDSDRFQFGVPHCTTLCQYNANQQHATTVQQFIAQDFAFSGLVCVTEMEPFSGLLSFILLLC